MEDKHQVTSFSRPALRHKSSISDAKQQFENTSSSLKPAAAERISRGREHPYLKNMQMEIIPTKQDTSHKTISSMSISPSPLKSSPSTGHYSRTFSSARSSDNMHTILELRQGKPWQTNGPSKPVSKPASKTATSGLNNGSASTNGFNKSGLHNNKLNPQTQFKESSNGYAQIPLAKNAPISKETRYDQVVNNNRRNSSKDCRLEANILEKAHLIQKVQSSEEAARRSVQCATVTEIVTPDGPGGNTLNSSSNNNNNNSNGVENKNSVVVVKLGPSGYMNGHHGGKSLQEVPELPQPHRNSFCNGDLKELDIMSKRSATDSGVTNGRPWSGVSSIRSDNSVKELSSDDDDDDSGFYLQENDLDNDTFDESNNSVASFAGRRNYLMPEKVICGVTGTVRGMRNRVRAGIATFVQPNIGTKNFSQLETSKVVVYTTTNGIVRETFQKCLKVKTILSTFLVPFEERDIFKYRAYQRELTDRLDTDQIAVPQVFVEGHYLGDANVIEELNELGKLRKILRPYKRPGAHTPCQKCGGYKLLLCNACNGSKKSGRRNRFTESLNPLRCGKCDECGLIQCDLCCKVPNEDNSIKT